LDKRLQKKIIFYISQSETSIACGGHVCQQTWPPQAIHVYDCMLSKKKNQFLCGKGDNFNLNIDTMN
jgi:hypothetical protein